MTIPPGSLALRFNLGWRTLALGLSPVPVAVGIVLRLLPMPSLVDVGLVRIPTRQLVRQRFFLLTMVTIFLGGATELGMAYWLPAYAEKSLGYSPSACILVGFTGSCHWPTTLAVAADRYPRGGATMFALLGALGNFGGIFMPWLVGVVADHWGLRWGLTSATLCPLADGRETRELGKASHEVTEVTERELAFRVR